MDGHKVSARETVLGEDDKPIFLGPPFSIVGMIYSPFAGDHQPFIIWHHSSTGETRYWGMFNHKVIHQATLLGEDDKPIFVGPPFSIVGAGHTDPRVAGGRDYILCYNSSTGESQFWVIFEGDNPLGVSWRATVVGEDGKPISLGPPFSIVGVGDFDRNKGDDILWHNSSTGESRIWFMDYPSAPFQKVISQATVVGEDDKPTSLGPPFSIVGVGDFNGDERADILWHNSSTGENQIWFMDGHKVSARETVLGEDGKPASLGPPFSIVGVSFFNQGLFPEPGAPK